MLRINYISNFSLENDGGGWNGMNRNVFQQLEKFCLINSIDSVNPDIHFAEKIISKLQRTVGMKGLFPAFGERRLREIATIVKSRIDKSCDLSFFHGVTPWLKVDSSMPYACFVDATFATYISHYHSGVKFSINKIIKQEREFLKKAKAVFFSSRWALDQTCVAYQLEGQNFFVCGLGGNIPIAREWPDSPRTRFVFIGLDFYAKGGEIAVQAFQKFRKLNNQYKLTFIGAKPPDSVLGTEGVEYVGYLDKKKPEELRKFQQLLIESAALLLPTTKDITPLVIIEAGYYGVPSIASKAFAIPEIIGFGHLCNFPVSDDELYKAMEGVIKESHNSKEVREYYLENFTWDIAGRIIRSVLTDDK